MKKLLSLFFALALAVGASASIKQVTTLTTTAATIVIPGIRTTFVTIQNNGVVNVRLTFDGGSIYTDPNTQLPGTNPTVSTGYLLAVGQQIIISYASPANIRPIRAIAASATATLDITTDDTNSTFPTN